MYRFYNPNSTGRMVGDCAIRALSKALSVDWDTAFAMAAKNAYLMSDMPSSNGVWGSVLREHDFIRLPIPNSCPDCYTAEDFCRDHPHGIFVLGFGNHVATVVDGDLYDSWDSSREIPQYYWARKDDV